MAQLLLGAHEEGVPLLVEQGAHLAVARDGGAGHVAVLELQALADGGLVAAATAGGEDEDGEGKQEVGRTHEGEPLDDGSGMPAIRTVLLG